MAGGWAIPTMNAAIKRNEIKRDRRTYFQQKPKYTSKEVKKLYSKKLPTKELYRLKAKARHHSKKEELINSMLLVLSVLLTSLVLYFIVEIISPYYLNGIEVN
jgi:hypothetical protein